MKQILFSILFILFTGFGFLNAQPAYRVIPDVIYGHKAGMALTYDVIQPADTVNGAGIIHVVSGGWSSRYSPSDSVVINYVPFLEKGYTVFMLRHGSAPWFKVPDATDDVLAGARHIYENAARYGVDSARIGIYGGSSGGQLSLITGYYGEKKYVSAIVAFFPPTDLRNMPDFAKAMLPAMDFDSTLAERVSPDLYVTPDDPPTLLINGDNDFMVPLVLSQNLYKLLRENNVPSKLVILEGMGHGNSYGGKGKYYEPGLKEMLGWFDLYLSSGSRSNVTDTSKTTSGTGN